MSKDHLAHLRTPDPLPEDWDLPDGRRVGMRFHVSPYNGAITEAVVQLDTNEVIAMGCATCHPHFLVTPPGVVKGMPGGGFDVE